MASYVNTAAVMQRLGLNVSQVDEFAPIAAAVNDLVALHVPESRRNLESVKLGADMLAARLWRRRDTPSGVESISELGPTYVARYDPDLDKMLCLNDYKIPTVG